MNLNVEYLTTHKVRRPRPSRGLFSFSSLSGSTTSSTTLNRLLISYNSLPHLVCISPYHYPKNVYGLPTHQPHFPAWTFGKERSKLACVVIPYAWDCSSWLDLCFLSHLVKCSNDVFAGWVICSLNGSRVGTVRRLLSATCCCHARYPRYDAWTFVHRQLEFIMKSYI
jgi:hypothetical protein